MIGRIRTVKPEIFAHYLLWHLGELTQMPKLAYWYIGLWCMTDREGRVEWKPMELKAALAPFDDIDFARVLNVLANAGFVVRYRVGSRHYGWLPRFLTHQNINGRESATRLPAPPQGAEAYHEAHMLAADFEALSVDELLAEAPIVEDAVTAAKPTTSRVSHASPTRQSRDTTRTEQNGTELNGTEQVTTSPRAPRTFDRSRARSLTPRDGVALDVTPEQAPDALGGSQGAPEHERGAESASAPSERPGSALGTLADPGPGPGEGADPGPGPGHGLVVVDDSTRNVPALPALRGKGTGVALRERLGIVFGEVQAGTRTRMKREQLRRLNAELVFVYWQARFDHPAAILTPTDKRRARIEARLKENDDNVSELLYALDGAFNDDHIMARNRYEGETKYDTIDTILRDRGQVEKFASRRKGFKEGTPHKALAQLMADLGTDTTEG